MNRQDRSLLTYKVILLFLTLFSIAFTGCNQQAGTSSSGQSTGRGAGGGRGAGAVSVAVAPVVKQDVPVYLSGLGTVTAFYTEGVKSRIDGQLTEVRFKEGDNVKAGDLLAII